MKFFLAIIIVISVRSFAQVTNHHFLTDINVESPYSLMKSIDVDSNEFIRFEMNNSNKRIDLNYYSDDELIGEYRIDLDAINNYDFDYGANVILKNKTIYVYNGTGALYKFNFPKIGETNLKFIDEYKILDLPNIHVIKSIDRLHFYSFDPTSGMRRKGRIATFEIKTDSIYYSDLDIDFPAKTIMGPSQYVDFLYSVGTKMVKADVSRYRITFYEKGKLQDSIIIKNERFFTGISGKDSSDAKLIENDFSAFSELANQNMEHLKSFGQIWRVHYVAEDKVLVTFSKPKGGGFEFTDHLWEKKESGWELVKTVEAQELAWGRGKRKDDSWLYYTGSSKVTKISDNTFRVFYFVKSTNFGAEKARSKRKYFSIEGKTEDLRFAIWEIQF